MTHDQIDTRTRVTSACGILENLYRNNLFRLSDAEAGALPWIVGYLQGINNVTDADVTMSVEELHKVEPPHPQDVEDQIRRDLWNSLHGWSFSATEIDRMAKFLAWDRANRP